MLDGVDPTTVPAMFKVSVLERCDKKQFVKQHPPSSSTSSSPLDRVIKEAGSRRSFSRQRTVLRRGDCYGEEVTSRSAIIYNLKAR